MHTDALAPLAYSINEAARVTSLSRSRIYQLIAAGTIQTKKLGNRTLVPASSLRALIEGEAA
jgi:excisionase family DNA binding protein